MVRLSVDACLGWRSSFLDSAKNSAICISSREYFPLSTPDRIQPPTPSATPARPTPSLCQANAGAPVQALRVQRSSAGLGAYVPKFCRRSLERERWPAGRSTAAQQRSMRSCQVCCQVCSDLQGLMSRGRGPTEGPPVRGDEVSVLPQRILLGGVRDHGRPRFKPQHRPAAQPTTARSQVHPPRCGATGRSPPCPADASVR